MKLAVVVFFFSIVSSGCEESEIPEKLVDEIDVTQMSEAHLNDFKILFEDIGYQNKGKFIVFESNDKESAITMYFEICSSQEDAETTINGIFDDMPGQVIGEPYDGEYIGEKFWWTPTDPKNQSVNIIFLRYNVYFILISRDVDMMIELIKNIDADLLNEASYISFL
jgi:hypothetical protein